MKKIALLFIVVLFTKIVFPQGKVVIRGYTESTDVKSVKVFPPIGDCVKGWTAIDQIIIDSTGHFQKAVAIDKPTLIFLRCGEQIGSFVSPGDTVDIYIKKLENQVTDFDGHLSVDRRVQATIKGTSVTNSFFSVLEAQTTKIDNVPFRTADQLSLDEKCVLLKKLYQQRLVFYNDFLAKHPDLSEEFKVSASGEIKGTYFYRLLSSPGPIGGKLGKTYLDEITNEKFTWTEAGASREMMNTARVYFGFYLDTMKGEGYSARKFTSKYNLITDHVSDIQLKDYLLTNLMAFFLEKEPDNYGEIFERYKNTCTNKAYVENMDSVYKGYSANLAMVNMHLTDSAMAVSVTDTTGTTRRFAEVLNQHKESIFFVDFWASWCGPCIQEIPYLKDLERKYDKKIVFISLSIDERRPDWLTALKNHNLTGNQYLMDPTHKNFLARQLNVKTIPRFVLMTANGEILNFDLPKPFATERIGKIIDKALAGKAAKN